MSDLKAGVLFVNHKRAPNVRFLRYDVDLLFRSQLSANAVAWARRNLYDGRAEGYGKDIIIDFHKLFSDALMCYLAMEQLGLVNMHKGNRRRAHGGRRGPL